MCKVNNHYQHFPVLLKDSALSADALNFISDPITTYWTIFTFITNFTICSEKQNLSGKHERHTFQEFFHLQCREKPEIDYLIAFIYLNEAETVVQAAGGALADASWLHLDSVHAYR